jgi:hypothetical protein
MRQVTWIAIVAVAAAASAACGKSEAEKRAEEAARQAEQMAAAAQQQAAQAQDMAKGMEQMAQGLQQLAGGDQKPVEPVAFRDLQAVFPTVEGWTMGKPTGERMTMPVNFSQAEVTYTKGDASVEASVIDSGFHQLLVAPYTMFLSAGYERQTEDGYEKSASVAGHPGWERWNDADKSGELNAFVGKRFLVKFEGQGLADAQVLHAFAKAADLNKLASLK